MKELFRIDQGILDSWLDQYCLTIYERDVMYIQSISDRSLNCLREVLSGERSLDSGKLYLEEELLERYDSSLARKYGIYTVAFGREFIENMSIADNLISIQPAWKRYSREKTLREIENYFQKEELNLDPELPVWKLSDTERKKLGILKARLHGARLIILDMTGSGVEGKMAEEIGSMVRRMNREGMTFLILASGCHEISNVATRAQFLYNGRDIKEWKPLSEETREKLRSGSFCMFAGWQEAMGRDDLFSVQKEETAGDNLFPDRRERNGGKKFTGLYDYEWDISRGIWEYLSFVREYNPMIWESCIGADIPKQGDGRKDRTAVIPCDSKDLLLSHLSVEENLTIAAAGRIADGVYGRIRKKLEQRLVMDFYREMGLDPSVHRIEDLSRIQRKILSIARWAVTKPETVILETPYSDLNPVEILQLRGYLMRLEEKGTRIIYFAKSLETMAVDCRRIIRTQNGMSAKIDTL